MRHTAPFTPHLKGLRSLLFTLASTALLAACATTNSTPAGAIAPSLAPSFANSDGSTGTSAPGHFGNWWQTFADPVLDRLVDRALARNIDVRIAVARIDEARALRHGAASRREPEMDVGAAAGQQRVSGNQIGFSAPVTRGAYDTELSASWEIDLFGRISGQVRAANADVAATTQNMHAARVAVAAEVAGDYFAARGLEQQLAIVRESQQADQETAQHTGRMFAAGTASREDLDRATAQAATGEAEIPALERERQLAIQRIAVLLAAPPQNVYAALAQPAPQGHSVTVAPGVPADLLRSRPDIAAAEARVLAAYARIGVAEADLKPRLQLSGLIGSLLDAFTGASLVRSMEWLASASATAPLLDGGRRRSVVELRRAEANEARLHYQSTVLTAVEDVENALASRDRDRERVSALSTAAARTQSATDRIRESWQAGVTPILELLEAQRAQLLAEDQLAQARTAMLRDEVLLFAALGGGEGR